MNFHLKVTYGDPYYIGLNGIEIYNDQGFNLVGKNAQNPFKISASPPGVFIINKMEKDKRKIQNLVDGFNNNTKYKHIWLAPLILYKIEESKNIISIEFQDPVVFSLINIYNYKKTPSRGVREIDIFCDDNLIYSGYLNHPDNDLVTSIVLDPTVKMRLNSNIPITPPI